MFALGCRTTLYPTLARIVIEGLCKKSPYITPWKLTVVPLTANFKQIFNQILSSTQRVEV